MSNRIADIGKAENQSVSQSTRLRAGQDSEPEDEEAMSNPRSVLVPSNCNQGMWASGWQDGAIGKLDESRASNPDYRAGHDAGAEMAPTTPPEDLDAMNVLMAVVSAHRRLHRYREHNPGVVKTLCERDDLAAALEEELEAARRFLEARQWL